MREVMREVKHTGAPPTLGRKAEEPMQIDERVRQAHLDHYCPGGVGVPLKDSRPIGLGTYEDAAAEPARHAASAPGERCGRCEEAITPGQDVRRRVGGSWVHENCPA